MNNKHGLNLVKAETAAIKNYCEGLQLLASYRKQREVMEKAADTRILRNG